MVAERGLRGHWTVPAHHAVELCNAGHAVLQGHAHCLTEALRTNAAIMTTTGLHPANKRPMTKETAQGAHQYAGKRLCEGASPAVQRRKRVSQAAHCDAAAAAAVCLARGSVAAAQLPRAL